MEKGYKSNVHIGYSIKVEDGFETRHKRRYYVKTLVINGDNKVSSGDVITTTEAKKALTFATAEEAQQYVELFDKGSSIYEVRYTDAKVVKVLTPGGELK